MVNFGIVLGKYKITRFLIKILLNYQNSFLEQEILGIKFKNPIGLSAGFDKNAELTDILPNVGFGFAELGSVTAGAYPGNEGTRLWRLPESKSLVVYYGLKNDGAVKISKKLYKKFLKQKNKIPLGISIAKTNCHETVDIKKGVEDYITGIKYFTDLGEYLTINVSCPNTFGGQPFHDEKSLDLLLTEIDELKISKPVLLKISPDLSKIEVDKIIEITKQHAIDGFVVSNLTKNRKNPKIKDKKIPQVGGMSGKVVEEMANEMIGYIYNKTKGKYLIIGCGGIFSAEDAYKKIKNGSNLVQLITGMIYEGPQLISEINLQLVKLLKKDGYKNIQEAVGINFRKNLK
jgi:dihydroorotate dehydrogenase